MEFYVYLVKNLVNSKSYIGKHFGELNDSYIGSGSIIKRAVNKYGKENFTKIILEQCNENDVDEKEKYWIKKFDAVKNKLFYNLTEGGTGGNTLKNLSEEQKQARIIKIKEKINNISDKERERLCKIKSENTIKQRKDKTLEKKRINKFKKTMKNKDEKWKKERYKNQAGSNHYCATKVSTPFGDFNTASEAAKIAKVSVQTIINRCKNEKFKGWNLL